MTCLSNFQGTRSDWTCHSLFLFIFVSTNPSPLAQRIRDLPNVENGHLFGRSATWIWLPSSVDCVSWQRCCGTCCTIFARGTTRRKSQLHPREQLCGRRIARYVQALRAKEKEGWNCSGFKSEERGCNNLVWLLEDLTNSVSLYNNFESPLQESIKQVLQSVVGPGDLLSSDIRADFAAEAYAAWGDCPGCIKAKHAELPSNGENFAKFNEEEWLGEERWVQCVFLDIFFLWSNIGHLEVHFRNLRLISISCWVGEIPTNHFVDGPWWGISTVNSFPTFLFGRFRASWLFIEDWAHLCDRQPISRHRTRHCESSTEDGREVLQHSCGSYICREWHLIPLSVFWEKGWIP